MAIEVLTGEPGGYLLRAARGLLPSRRGDDLPDRELVRHGVGTDRARLAAYDRVCGQSLLGA